MPYDISDYQINNLEDTVSKLERQKQRFDDLDNSLDELRGELESLQRTVDDNDCRSQDHIGELREKLEELESDIGDAIRALSQLGDRMGWVERHIRASGGATEVNFDDQASALKPLLQKIKQGQQAQAQLLDDADRRQLKAAVARFDQQAKRINELTTAALESSTTLTATIYGEEEHTKAAQAFRAALTARQSETKLHQQQRTQAEQARTRLTQDDQLRNMHAATIRAGKDAAASLRQRLRATIANSLGDSALPPVWFTTTLGITPPRSGTEEWLDTATEVVAYRITYGVTDPVLALGTKPQDINTDRYWWHNQLVDKLRRYTS